MELYKTLVDGAAVLSLGLAWLGVFSLLLTIVATLFTIIWLGIRIWESDTVKQWIKDRSIK